MPELVAAFHSLVGLAAVFVAAAALYSPAAFTRSPTHQARSRRHRCSRWRSAPAIGAITFTGSVIAFGKAVRARVRCDPIMLPARHMINIGLFAAIVILHHLAHAPPSRPAFWLIVILSLVFGVLIIIPIGGADMPVVVSMLNSYSGWAAAGIGFTLGNTALIITGALVGSSGAILSYIMCKGMNRSFISVILGGFGGETAGPARRRRRGQAGQAGQLRTMPASC